MTGKTDRESEKNIYDFIKCMITFTSDAINICFILDIKFQKLRIQLFTVQVVHYTLD